MSVTLRGYVELAYLGTEYVADYVYRAGEIEVTSIRFDECSPDGRTADEHSPFYGTLQKIAHEAAWQDAYAMMDDARVNYGGC